MESKWCDSSTRAKCRHQQQQSIHDRSTGSPDQPDQPIKMHTCGKRSLVPDSNQGHLWRCAECSCLENKKSGEVRGLLPENGSTGLDKRVGGERERAHHRHGLDIFKHGVLGLLRARDFQTNKQTIKQNHLVSNRFLPSKPSDLKHIFYDLQ